MEIFPLDEVLNKQIELIVQQSLMAKLTEIGVQYHENVMQCSRLEGLYKAAKCTTTSNREYNDSHVMFNFFSFLLYVNIEAIP